MSLLVADDDSEKETKNNEQGDSYKEDKVRKGFKTEPVGQCVERLWENGN